MWLASTGELLAIREPDSSTHGNTGMGEVVRIAVETDPQRLHAAVAGWEEHVSDWNGLAWIAGRFGIAASSDASAAATAPASWYPDPWRPGGLRWWDGIQWTHHATPGVGRESRAPAEKPPPPTFPAIAGLWVVGGILAGHVLGFALIPVTHVVHSWTFIDSSFYALFYGVVAATCVIASRRYGSGRLGKDFGWHFEPGDLWRGPLVFVLTALVVGPITSPLVNNRSVRRGSELLHYSETHRPFAATVVLVVVALVAAPLLEELLFRGVLLRSLTSFIGVRWAVVVQGLCFGLYHLAPWLGGFALFWMLSTALFGIGAGIAATRWRRLGPTIVAHATLNGLHLIAVFTSR